MKIRHDYVTNSSSSCFVVKTTHNGKEIEAFLRKLLRAYNELMDQNLSYDGVFHGPYKYSIEDFRRDKRERDCWNYVSKDNVDRYMIFSASDNAIPYELFHFIETKFKTWREHLG